MHHLCDNWTLMGRILDHALSLDDVAARLRTDRLFLYPIFDFDSFITVLVYYTILWVTVQCLTLILQKSCRVICASLGRWTLARWSYTPRVWCRRGCGGWEWPGWWWRPGRRWRQASWGSPTNKESCWEDEGSLSEYSSPVRAPLQRHFPAWWYSHGGLRYWGLPRRVFVQFEASIKISGLTYLKQN